jgi:hypothetical protein
MRQGVPRCNGLAGLYQLGIREVLLRPTMHQGAFFRLIFALYLWG